MFSKSAGRRKIPYKRRQTKILYSTTVMVHTHTRARGYNLYTTRNVISGGTRTTVVPVVCAKGVYKNDKHRRDVLIYLRAATETVYFILFFSRYTGRPSPRAVARTHAQHVIIRDRCRLEAYRYYGLCVCVYAHTRVCVCIVCVCVWE